MVARLIPDQKVGCSTHSVLTFSLFPWNPFSFASRTHTLETTRRESPSGYSRDGTLLSKCVCCTCVVKPL